MNADLITAGVYCFIFLAIAFIDWRYHLIPNVMVFSAAVFSLIILAISSLFPWIGLLSGLYLYPQPDILSGLLGSAVGLVFFGLFFSIAPEGLGAGDVKLASLVGLVVGFPTIFLAIFIGIVCGALFALLLSRKRVNRSNELPLGSFLSLGAMIALLWGADIIVLCTGSGYWGYGRLLKY